MDDELVFACILERLDDLIAYYEALDDSWAHNRSLAIATLARQYRKTGIKALVEFQTQRQHDLRSALRGTMGLYVSPHAAEDIATHARYIQSLFYEGQFITGLIGLA
jgi:hypothetical protein